MGVQYCRTCCVHSVAPWHGTATCQARPAAKSVHVCALQDVCSLEGVSGGSLPPGVQPSGFKPLGTCTNNTDCSDDNMCNFSGKTICSCAPATGTDVCEPIGMCVMKPCKQCEQCYTAMQSFPDMVKSTAQANVVASRWVLLHSVQQH